MSLAIYAETRLPTQFGPMRLRAYRRDNSPASEPLALVSGYLDRNGPVNVRIHSACLTSEVFSSCKCDCKQQLDFALDYISARTGIVIYLPQEGRGIGLGDKVRVYALQEHGYDTIEANVALHLPVDARQYDDALDILRDLGVTRVNLLTNNPEKLDALATAGIEVAARIPVATAAPPEAGHYLQTKRIRMGHLLDP